MPFLQFRFAGVLLACFLLAAIALQATAFAQTADKKLSDKLSDRELIDTANARIEKHRKANPKAMLLINDYRTDPPYEKVIEQLVDAQGKPMYDVIGIQNHMFEGPWPNTR